MDNSATPTSQFQQHQHRINIVIIIIIIIPIFHNSDDVLGLGLEYFLHIVALVTCIGFRLFSTWTSFEATSTLWKTYAIHRMLCNILPLSIVFGLGSRWHGAIIETTTTMTTTIIVALCGGVVVCVQRRTRTTSARWPRYYSCEWK